MIQAQPPAQRMVKSRSKAKLKPTLDKNLIAYAAAAGAAGVTVLVGAAPASAQIVYTPAHVNISEPSGSYALDVNGDGVTDFTLRFCRFASHGSNLALDFGAAGNGVRVALPGPFRTSYDAAALKVGQLIGREQKFKTTTSSGYCGVLMGAGYTYGGVSEKFGPWVNVTRRYLGLKFMIAGEVHFGWARLNVSGPSIEGGSAVLTGYAYQMQANTLIRAGEESSSPEKSPSSPAASAEIQNGLGSLALGVKGFGGWRQ